jgi:plastocyanin
MDSAHKILLIMALTLGLSGCLQQSSPSGPSMPHSNVIDIGNETFQPDNLTVPVNTTVTWVNQNGPIEVVAEDGMFDSGQLYDGYEYNHTFLQPGVYDYHSKGDPSLSGRIVVTYANGSMPAYTPVPVQQTVTVAASTTGDATIGLVAKNIAFNTSTITVPAGARVTVSFDNQDKGVPHNFAVYETRAAKKSIFQGKIITGLAKIAYTFTAPSKPGNYYFQCDVHPSMNGQFIVVSQGAFPSTAGPEVQASQLAAPIGAPSVPIMAEMNKRAASQGYAVLVEISRYAYSPDSITVPAGTMVVWRNLDPVLHTVTNAEGKFDSGIIEPGKNFSYTFEDPDTYDYYCTIHPYMKAKIIVTPPAELQIAATGLNQTESNPSPISLSEPESVGTTIEPISTTSPQPSTRIVVDLLAKDMRFDKDKITVIAGSRVFINFVNLDVGVPHNFALYTGSEAIKSIFLGQVIIGPSKITYSFNAPVDSGKYFFRCDVHPKVMTGDFYVVSYEDLEPPQASTASQVLPEMNMPSANKSAIIDLVAENIAFNENTITVPAGADVIVNFNNRDSGVPHNFAVYETQAAEKVIFKGEIITGLKKTTYTFTAPDKPGTYFFRCDVHPTQMTGQFMVK